MDEPLRIPRGDEQRIERLRARWRSYHRQFLAGTASRESVLGAYTDWVDAVDGVRQRQFEADQGARILREAGINTTG